MDTEEVTAIITTQNTFHRINLETTAIYTGDFVIVGKLNKK